MKSRRKDPPFDAYSVARSEGEIFRWDKVEFLLDIRVQRREGSLTPLLNVELLRVMRVHRDEGDSPPLYIETLNAPLSSNYELCFLPRFQTEEMDRASLSLKIVDEFLLPDDTRGSVRLRPHVAVEGIRLVSVNIFDLGWLRTTAPRDDPEMVV